jgi:hypothetical protein
MPEIAHRRYALLLALAMVLALAGVTAHSAFSRGHRGELERWSQETAVGDKRLYPLGAEAPALTFRGKPLIPQTGQPHEVRETRVVCIGEDDSKHFRIYLHREPGAKEPDNDQVYLLKTGQSEFVKMQLSEKK